MTIKVNYTKEKGLVQELDTTGEGGFLVQGTEIGKKKVELIEVNTTLTANDTNKIFRVRNSSKTIKIPEPSSDIEGVIYKFIADANMTNNTVIETINGTQNKFVGQIITVGFRHIPDGANDTKITFNNGNTTGNVGESQAKHGDFIELTCLNKFGVDNPVWAVTGISFGRDSIFFS